jgi:alkylation response protein AidB-like acyl-CoA dehydrogenase
LHDAIAYVKERKQFGAPIGDKQHIQVRSAMAISCFCSFCFAVVLVRGTMSCVTPFVWYNAMCDGCCSSTWYNAMCDAFRVTPERVLKSHNHGNAIVTLQFKLADMATQLTAARMMIRHAAAMVDSKDPTATMYCM